MKLNKYTTLQLCGAIAAALAVTACGPSEEKKPESSASAPPAAPSAPAAPAPSALAPAPAPSAPATAASAPASAPAAPAHAPAAAAPSAPAAPSGDPAAPPAGVAEADLAPITPEYPKPMFVGTPVPMGDIPNLEKPDPEAQAKRETFKLPKGTTNVALKKPVTSSDANPIIGTLDLVTDGDLDGADGSYVELGPGKQWVQIDLGGDFTIYKLLVWHFHKQSVVFFSVAAQISDDPEFKTGVTTVYNNDHDNSLGFGPGPDKAYVETNHGRLMDAKSTKGRYVRLWSKGNSGSDANDYVEVQVYGQPAK